MVNRIPGPFCSSESSNSYAGHREDRSRLSNEAEFTYKIIPIPRNFPFQAICESRKRKREEITDLFNISNKPALIADKEFKELDALSCTIRNCIELYHLSEDPWSHEFYSRATKNTIKFLDECSGVHKHKRVESLDVFYDAFKEINPLFEILSAKFEWSQDEDLDCDLLLKSLIKIVSAQIKEEKKHTILGYFANVKDFLHQQFLRYYDTKRYGSAKTAFFYYIWSLGDEIPDGEKERIKKAKKPLAEIFQSLSKKSYVPYDCSDVIRITDGMVSLMHMDLFLLAFFYQFERIVHGIDKGPLNLKKLKELRIRDWKILCPFPPEVLKEKMEVYTELLSATSNAKLNSVGEMQITCSNQVDFSTGMKRSVRLEREEKRELIQKIACENEILTQLRSSDKEESAKDKRLRGVIEQTEENTVESDHQSGKEMQMGSIQEGVTSTSLSATDRKRNQHSTAQEKAFEEGDRWQVSSVDAQEDGVEITDARRQRRETSKETKESQTKRARVAHELDGGVGLGGGKLDFFGFIPSINLNYKRTSTGETEEGSSFQEGNLEASEKEDMKSARESRRKEFQRSRNEERIGKKSDSNTLEAAIEKEQEHSQDQKVTLCKKSDLVNTDQLRKKLGLRGQGRQSKDNEAGIKRIETSDHEKEERCSVRTNFNLENARSLLNHNTEEYTRDELRKEEFRNVETFALKQGYLLISKVEYLRKTTLIPVKFVVEMDYNLTDDRLKQLEVRDISFKVDEEDDTLYLLPLLERIQTLATHRFHMVAYDMKMETGSLIIKNLALEIWNDDRASHDRANQLNIIFHRLGRFLDNHCHRPSEQAWTQYHVHKNTYIEAASLKYCDDAAESLHGMFMAFQGDSAVCGSEQFLRLHSEFQGMITEGIHSQQHLLPPNRDSGMLLNKEPAHGLLLGQKQLTLQDSYKNLLVVGSVGCGKTSRIIIPNLLQLENCSILVTDVDGEIYSATAGIMEKKGFEVRVINIQDEGRNGDRFNPLDHLTAGPDSYDDIRRSVDCMMKARGFDETKAEKDAFWVIGGKMILEVALRLLLLDKAKAEAEGRVLEVTLAALHKKVGCLTKEEIERFVKEKKNEGKRIESEALEVIAQSVMSGDNSFSDRASYAKSAVEYCSSPVVKNLTNSSTLDFSQIRKKSTVIYFKIRHAQLSQYQFLLSLFYNRFFSTCYKKSRVGAISGHSSLPVVCLMDEFGHTPIPDFHTVLTTNRKHEISVVAVVQSISQVMELYGERNGNTMLGGGFASKLYFSLDPSDVQIARNISDAYGKVMDRGGRTIDASGSVSHREEEKPGLTIEEVIYPGAGNAIFIHTGYKPIKLRLTPYFENERFQEIMQVKSSPIDFTETPPLRKEPSSIEEEIEALIALLKERNPSLNGQRIRKLAHLRKGESIRSYLSRQGFVVGDEMTKMIEQICAERKKLFECPRFQLLGEESQENIRKCVEYANSVTNEEVLDAFVELLDLLYAKDFRSSEIIQFEEIGIFSTKKPELGVLIFQNLSLQYRLNGGNISKAEILKGLEGISSRFTKDDTEEYWKSLIEMIQTLLKEIYEDKSTLKFETNFALFSLGRLVQLSSFLQNPIQDPEFCKIINELKKIDALSTLVLKKTLIIEGQKWNVIRTEVSPDKGDLVDWIKIEKMEGIDKATKLIRFNRKNGDFSVVCKQN